METQHSNTARVDGNLNQTTGFLHPNMLPDVAHTSKNSEQLYTHR